MQHSKTELHYHFVWATYRRAPLIGPSWEPEIYACLRRAAAQEGAQILALGGMADHVHLVVTLPPRIAVSRFMQQVKGITSTFVRQNLAQDSFFGWQDHYAAFSISRSHISRVVQYVENQKQHHAAGTLWTQWEETDGEIAPPPATKRELGK